MLLSRRGVTNIIATMLIFGLMISALGILYAQISPTLLGYESRTETANQDFILTNIAGEVQELLTAASGAQRRVDIFSESTQFNVNNGVSLRIAVSMTGTGEITADTSDIGQFVSTVSGSFQSSTSPNYLNRVFNEATYVTNDTQEAHAPYVAKASYTTDTGEFTLYFRSYISVFQNNAGNWEMNIAFVAIEYITADDGSPINFPVEQDQWTLRLRRRPATVSTPTTITVNDDISLTQTIDGESGTTYSFPGINPGEDLTIRFITIPILFSI